MSNEIIKLAKIEEKIFNNGSDVTMKTYLIKERTESMRHIRFAILNLLNVF